MEILISEHANFEMKRRNIPSNFVLNVARDPQQKVLTSGGRTIYQSVLDDLETGKKMLFRVIVKDDKDKRNIITVYKTSKINKYWESGEKK